MTNMRPATQEPPTKYSIFLNIIAYTYTAKNMCQYQGWAPRPAGNPPRGEGGVPRPAPRCGEGGVPRPAPPRKNDQNRGEVAGQNKYPNLNFLQKRKEVMEQYYNTEQCPIQPVNRICKRK